jgi:hypothetical protein
MEQTDLAISPDLGPWAKHLGEGEQALRVGVDRKRPNGSGSSIVRTHTNSIPAAATTSERMLD